MYERELVHQIQQDRLREAEEFRRNAPAIPHRTARDRGKRIRVALGYAMIRAGAWLLGDVANRPSIRASSRPAG